MAVTTPEHYLRRAKAMKPRVYVNGKRVEDITSHPVTKTVVEANLASYEWARNADSRSGRLFRRPSHLNGAPCNRNCTSTSKNGPSTK